MLRGCAAEVGFAAMGLRDGFEVLSVPWEMGWTAARVIEEVVRARRVCVDKREAVR